MLATEDRSCLTNASELKGDYTLVDVRSREEFSQFHIAGAVNLTTSELISSPLLRGKRIIIYDSGKFASDAYQICDRLRRAGANDFKLLDGGIAAWAQIHGDPMAAELSRLSDSEIIAALFASGTTASSPTPSLKRALESSSVPSQFPDGAVPARTVLLASDAQPFSAVLAQLLGRKRKVVSLYWTGSAEKLGALINNQRAQDSKRQAGPAESLACSAL